MNGNSAKEPRIIRHLRIADKFLQTGQRLDKKTFIELLVREGDDFGISGTIIGDKDKLKLAYGHKAWTKLRLRIKDEAALRGEASDILEMHDTYSKGLSQTIRYKIKGFSLFPLAERPLRRSDSLDAKLESVDLSGIDIGEVDSLFARLMSGTDDTDYELTKRKFIGRKFSFDINSIEKMEADCPSSAADIFAAYHNLLDKKESVAPCDYAYLLWRYARFLAANWRTDGFFCNQSVARNWKDEICKSYEDAIHLTGNDSAHLRDNTRYLSAYTSYLLTNRDSDFKKIESYFYIMLDNLERMENDMFKADCLIKAGEFLWLTGSKNVSGVLIDEAKDILSSMSATDRNALTKAIGLYVMTARMTAAEAGSDRSTVLHEYGQAYSLYRTLSEAERQADINTLHSLLSNYESELRASGDTAGADNILREHLYATIDTDEYILMAELMFKWAEELHISGTLKDNFEDYKAILNSISYSSSGYDYMRQEADLLSALWNYNPDNETADKADLLVELSKVQEILFQGSRICTDIVEKQYAEALRIYMKYAESDMEYHLKVIDTRMLIVRLHSDAVKDFHNLRQTDIRTEFENLLSFIGTQPRLSYKRLEALYYYSSFLNRLDLWDVARDVCTGALVIIDDITGDEDIYISLYIKGIYHNLIYSYQKAFRCDAVSGGSLSCNLDAIIASLQRMYENKPELLDLREILTLTGKCIEAYPTDAEQVRVRLWWRNSIIKHIADPQPLLSCLPKNRLRELKEWIRFYDCDTDIESRYMAVEHRLQLAEIYHELGLTRKEKQEYLRIRDFISSYRKVTGNGYMRYENIANEAIYNIYLSKKRYGEAMKYLDAIIARYTALREEDSSYHETVRKYKLERLSLEDKIFGG